jgi:hypothetical protein
VVLGTFPLAPPTHKEKIQKIVIIIINKIMMMIKKKIIIIIIIIKNPKNRTVTVTSYCTFRNLPLHSLFELANFRFVKRQRANCDILQFDI